MKKRHLILTGLLMAGLAMLAWGWARTPEAVPTYQGKKITAWLDEVDQLGLRRGLGSREEANKALASVGSKAVPYIIRRLRSDDSAWKRYYRDIFPKIPVLLRKF